MKRILLITAVLAVLGMSFYFSFNRSVSENVGATIGSIQHLDQVLAKYRKDCGQYPKKLDHLLSEFRSKCRNFPKDGYLKDDRIPFDGWNRPFRYRIIADGEYELVSMGPDGRSPGRNRADFLQIN